jgi:hypothetical protein
MKRVWSVKTAAVATMLALAAWPVAMGMTGLAAAAPPSFTQATGGIGMSSPTQFASFNAFDYGATGDRGTITYSNFTYPAPGSGVWLPDAGTYAFDVYLGAGTYAHSMMVATVTPVSPHRSTFTGTGYYLADSSYTWTVTGSVNGSAIAFHIVYTGTNAGYWFDGVGTFAADGSATGTGTDSDAHVGLTWTLPAGFAHEVLSYTAAVTCAIVSGDDATFGFTIPAGFPGLTGLNIVVKVHDGGSPGTNGDTWAHGVATSTCDGSVTNYPIVSGNLVVH